MTQKSNEKNLRDAYFYNGERVELKNTTLYIKKPEGGQLEVINKVIVDFCLSPPSYSYIELNISKKGTKTLMEHGFLKKYFSSDDVDLIFKTYKDYQSNSTYFTIAPKDLKFTLVFKM